MRPWTFRLSVVRSSVLTLPPPARVGKEIGAVTGSTVMNR